MLSPAEWQAVRLSVMVATWAVIVSLPLAVFTGFLLARLQFRWKWMLETAVNLPLVLPPVVTGYALLVLFGRNGRLGMFLEKYLGLQIVFSWSGAALAAAIVSFPLMVRAIRIAFQGVDRRLEQVARTLGAGNFDTFLTISLPLAARGVLAGAALAFSRSLGEFGATIMVAGNIPGETQTIPTAIFSRVQSPEGIEMSGRLVLASIVLAGLTLAASELLERRSSRRESA